MNAKSASKKNEDNETCNDAFTPCNLNGNALTGNSPTPSASDCKDDDKNRYNYDTVKEQDLPALVVRDAINNMRSDDTTVAPGFSSEVTGNSVMAGRGTVAPAFSPEVTGNSVMAGRSKKQLDPEAIWISVIFSLTFPHGVLTAYVAQVLHLLRTLPIKSHVKGLENVTHIATLLAMAPIVQEELLSGFFQAG